MNDLMNQNQKNNLVIFSQIKQHKDTLVLMQLFCVVSLNYDIINNGDKK